MCFHPRDPLLENHCYPLYLCPSGVNKKSMTGKRDFTASSSTSTSENEENSKPMVLDEPRGVANEVEQTLLPLCHQ